MPYDGQKKSIKKNVKFKRNDDVNSRKYSTTYFCSYLPFALFSVMVPKYESLSSQINITKRVSKVLQHNQSTHLLLSKVKFQLKFFFNNNHNQTHDK